MKKFTLVALAMMASASCFAQTTQTTLWNGEDTESTSGEHGGFWGDASPVLVENTETDGINPSAHCLMFKITKGGTDNTVKLPFKDWIKPSMNGSKRVSLMIRKANPENVIVQLSDPTDGSTGYWHNQATWYGGGDKWQKLVFDFTANGDFDNPGVMSITPQAGNIDGEQIVYIDNIVIEDAPRINGKLFSEYNAENPITGDLKLTGAWMKGTSTMVSGDLLTWTNNDYNDFEYFNSQATDGVTSIDMRGTVTKDVDIAQFFKNPNTIVYANQYYDRGDNNYANIVVDDIAKSLVLTDANAFNAPKGFKAESVKLTRDVLDGINSFVLPFEVTADELGATQVATYEGCEVGKTANFNIVDKVEANTPFLTKDAAKADVLNFNKTKEIAATSTDLGTGFVGVYAKTSAKDMYGINKEGKLQKGGEGAYVNAFHAYLNVENPAGVAFNGSTPTAINGVAADKVANTAVYDLSGRRVYGKLQKGLYIMNGKKVVVK